MKKLTVLIGVLVIAALLLSAIGCSSNTPSTSAPASSAPAPATSSAPAAQKGTVLRLAIPWPPGDPVTNNIQNFIDNFNKAANGKYVIELHPAGSLLKMEESLDSLRTGAVEMAGWPIGVFASADSRYAMAEMPFKVNTPAADAAWTTSLMPVYNTFQEKKFNSKWLFTFTCLGVEVIGTKPVKVAADWKGLLTQTVSPATAKFVEAMGGSSVAISFADGYQALQKGVVNASLQSTSFDVQFKMYEVTKYLTRGYFIPASLGVAINLDVFNKMPKDMQDLLVQTGLQAQKDTNDYFVKVSDQNTVTLTDKGMTVYNLPSDERNNWKQMTSKVVTDLQAPMPADFVDQASKLAADADSKYPYQAK